MHLTTIIACVAYSDFLRITLTAAKKASDCLCVVTSPQDINTIKLCKQTGTACLVTSVWRENGAVFNKGGALNEAIAHVAQLTPIDWLLLLDADTCLPMNARAQLEKQALNPTHLYTVRRRMCLTQQMWQTHVVPGKIDEIEFSAQHSTIAHEGYFQLWNQKTHPITIPSSMDAAKYDRKVAYMWHEAQRHVIPPTDLFVVHLGQKQLNWRGRRTARWIVNAPLLFEIKEQSQDVQATDTISGRGLADCAGPVADVSV